MNSKAASLASRLCLLSALLLTVQLISLLLPPAPIQNLTKLILQRPATFWTDQTSFLYFANAPLAIAATMSAALGTFLLLFLLASKGIRKPTRIFLLILTMAFVTFAAWQLDPRNAIYINSIFPIILKVSKFILPALIFLILLLTIFSSLSLEESSIPFSLPKKRIIFLLPLIILLTGVTTYITIRAHQITSALAINRPSFYFRVYFPTKLPEGTVETNLTTPDPQKNQNSLVINYGPIPGKIYSTQDTPGSLTIIENPTPALETNPVGTILDETEVNVNIAQDQKGKLFHLDAINKQVYLLKFLSQDGIQIQLISSHMSPETLTQIAQSLE